MHNASDTGYSHPMTATFNADTMLVASTQQISTTLSGEAVILHVANGLYYGLNLVGARAWELLQEPASLRHVVDTVVTEFDVEPATATADLLALATDLQAKGLLDVVPAPAS